MKRKYTVDLVLILMLGMAFLYFQYYTPRSAIRLSERVNQSTAGDYSEDRLSLAKDYEAYLAWILPKGDKTPSIGHYFIGKQRKLLDLRVKQAINEAKNTSIEKGHIRIWSLLNMGVIIKTSDKVIAIDTANIPFVSKAHDELASVVDIFLTTHSDGDHYNSRFLERALEQNKKMVFLEGFYFKDDSDSNPNIIKLTSGKRTNTEGIYITAFQTDHRGDGNFKISNCWYLIEAEGIKILHSGDGLAFENPTEIQNLRDRNDIDIFLANIMLRAQNINEIKPKVMAPLHLFKYMQSQEALTKTGFDDALEQYNVSELSAIDKKFLFAGESFKYPAN